MNGHNFGKLTSAFFHANIPNDKYGNGFRVITALCYFAQGKDRCWPGLGRLCELTGIGSTDTVKKWLLRLRESELIYFEDWASKKKTVYRLSQRLLGQRNYPNSTSELSPCPTSKKYKSKLPPAGPAENKIRPHTNASIATSNPRIIFRYLY